MRDDTASGRRCPSFRLKSVARKSKLAFTLKKRPRARGPRDQSRIREKCRPGPVLLPLDQVTPKRVRWLWPARIPRGKLTLLIGDPGLGKSLVTLDIASRVSTGTAWPDAPRVKNPSGRVVLLSAEDDPADTIVPRLAAAGANLKKIVALEGVRHEVTEQEVGGVVPFSLAADIPLLEKAIKSIGDVRLIVIDPISAYLGGGTDSHKDADVRRVLAPLADLAARHGVAILAVSHLNKRQGVSVVYRAMGSLAFTAAARAVWAVTKDRDDDARRLVLPVKCNLARDPSGMAYSIQNGPGGMGVVAWEPDPVEISAEDALSVGGNGASSALDDAVAWLRDELATGARSSRKLLRDARDNGIAEKTLRRASKRLGIKPYKAGGRWRWGLPIQDGQGGHVGRVGQVARISARTGSEGRLKVAKFKKLAKLNPPATVPIPDTSNPARTRTIRGR